MANELRTGYASGANVYAIIRSIADNKVWATDSGAFEVWSDASITDYDIALTDRGGDRYSADLPTGLTASTSYCVNYYVRSGTDPAISDTLIESKEGATEPPTPAAASGAITVADVVAVIRRQLNDTVASDYWWSDTTLLAYVNSAVEFICEKRPYLLLATATTVNTLTRATAQTDALVLGAEWKQAIADFACARALSEDDPEANMGRAKSFMSLFQARMG